MPHSERSSRTPVWGRSVQTRASGRPPPEYYWDGDHWSYTGGQHGDGRESAASKFACSTAQSGDAEGFLEAVDRFHTKGRDFELIHVGPKKGAWLDAATRLRKPLAALEFGTQIGYSAIRIGRLLPLGARLWTLEPNPDNASLAEANIRHVGLEETVTVLCGILEDHWQQVPCPVDFVFLDHSRAAYLRELKALEKWGYVVKGTVVVTDNIGGKSGSHGHAKAEEYASYVRRGGQYASSFHWGDDDGIEISEFTGLHGKPLFLTPETIKSESCDFNAVEVDDSISETNPQLAPVSANTSTASSSAGARRWARGRGERKTNRAAKAVCTSDQHLDECLRLPRLVVFDLDGVCWNPEMYQTRGGPPYRVLPGGDVIENSAGERIKLHGAVLRVWKMLFDVQSKGGDVQVAVASSSTRRKALPLLQTALVAPGISMYDVIGKDLLKLYYIKGQGKRPHLQELLRQTGIPPQKVLFLDDRADNISSVEGLGIKACLVEAGLSELAWQTALQAYATIS